MERHAGKVAIVTGASSGIGRAVALRLAVAGMRVAACARRLDRLDTLAAEVEGSGRILPIACDVRDESAIAAMFQRVRSELGPTWVVVNNAGLGHKAPLLSGDTALWREMLEVNVLGLCVCTREAVSDMRDNGDIGHVIHISSMAAYRVPGGGGVYAASKHAVAALTEGLRQELRMAGSKIRVSAISPGFVETEFAAQYHKSPEAADKTYGRYKVLESDDIAQAVEWVLSCPEHMQVHDILVRPTDQVS